MSVDSASTFDRGGVECGKMKGLGFGGVLGLAVGMGTLSFGRSAWWSWFLQLDAGQHVVIYGNYEYEQRNFLCFGKVSNIRIYVEMYSCFSSKNVLLFIDC